MARPPVADAIEPALLARIQEAVPPGSTVYTLARNRPNWVQEIASAGLYVETERSRKAGAEAQLVPGWMFNYAWRELQRSGRLTNQDLIVLAKRSSTVCAVLARLPEVRVRSSSPIELELVR